MSFRKRNVGLSSPSHPAAKGTSVSSHTTLPPGVRPSNVDSRPTTSTGSQNLDDLLAGHAGFPLGNSLLIEENGTTDFAAAWLRYFAAEGLVQGHHVHVIGMPEQWGRDLPGLVDHQEARGANVQQPDSSRMKIAWRYERLGEFGTNSRAPPLPDRSSMNLGSNSPQPSIPMPFCHSFDLTKRLALTPSNSIHYVPLSSTQGSGSVFSPILAGLTTALQNSPADSIHRILTPSLLSPAIYPPEASEPPVVLSFLHGLRCLLRRYNQQVVVMMTLPLSLHPRGTGLVRWMEYLCDGVLELAPFPYSPSIEPPMTTSKGASTGSAKSRVDERPQGLLNVHKMPVLTERGGGSGAGDDMAFSLGRRKFSIVKYHLPPVDGDTDAQRGETGEGVPATQIEF